MIYTRGPFISIYTVEMITLIGEYSSVSEPMSNLRKDILLNLGHKVVTSRN